MKLQTTDELYARYRCAAADVLAATNSSRTPTDMAIAIRVFGLIEVLRQQTDFPSLSYWFGAANETTSMWRALLPSGTGAANELHSHVCEAYHARLAELGLLPAPNPGAGIH